jgi:hypothetical protein
VVWCGEEWGNASRRIWTICKAGAADTERVGEGRGGCEMVGEGRVEEKVTQYRTVRYDLLWLLYVS